MIDEQILWHTLEQDEALARLDACGHGLSRAEADKRLEAFGANRLASDPRRPAWKRFFSQFNNLLIWVLVGAAVFAVLLDHALDAAVIMAVVLLNTLIGFIQEGKAERAMEAIGRMLAPRARVRRDGRWATVPAEELVPGDIVQLKSGDRIPADLRLLEVHGLRVDQAALTGESVPVSKRTDTVEEDTPLAERGGMAYSGTLVAGGQATGLVCETGPQSEIGKISGMLEQVELLTTPLLRQINRFGKMLTLVIVLAASALILTGWVVHALPLTEGFLAGVALAVAAIPEGLPAIITITLAVGVQRMAGRNAIIRKLPAVETLGAVSVICSDKTGTLTRNELEVARIVFADQVPDKVSDRPAGDRTAATSQELMETAVLCNDADPGAGDGDPLEVALVRMAEAAGADVAAIRRQQPRIGLIPFSSDLKFMATLHPGRICIKGAPETLLKRCDRQRIGNDDDQSLNSEYWNGQLADLAEQGLRVIAMASKEVAADTSSIAESDVSGGLVLLGLVAFEDPPRPEVASAVAACVSAGIRVKMITGDHAATAMAIARRLNITANGQALNGVELDRMSDAQLAADLENIDVFARTTPEHKLRLVKALQAKNRVVAMTGDGANDAPALKRADIGVAMGIKGTEASRQAAEMVLADDNFATIVNGVEEGRGVYDNIRKALLFILPTNAAEALVIILAVLAGVTLPITPVQILWINMATAVTLALALAFEPLEGNIMRRPPRTPWQGLITPFVAARILWVGLVLMAGTFALFLWVLENTGDVELARTVALNALVAGEVFYLFNARRWIDRSFSFEALFANSWAWISVAALIVVQAAITYLPPAQQVFGTVGLAPVHWLLVVLFGLALFWLVEAEKAVIRLRSQR